MTAETAYDLWEESSIHGLKELLKLIQRASKNDVMTSLVIGSDKISEEQIKALRRRRFNVIKRDLVGDQYKYKVEINWAHAEKSTF